MKYFAIFLLIFTFCPPCIFGVELKPDSMTIISKNSRAENTEQKLNSDHLLLLHYPFAGLQPQRHGFVKSAKLKFALANPNESKQSKAILGIFQQPMIDSTKWFDKKWPFYQTEPFYFTRKITSKRAYSGNVEYAFDKIGEIQIPATKTSFIEFDMTKEIDQIMYAGLANNGMALQIIGKADILIARTPVLEIKFAGSVPDNSERARNERAKKLYPSASLPPVSSPYIFLLTCWGRDDQKILWNNTRVLNVDGVYATPDIFNKNVLGLGVIYFRPGQWPVTEEHFRQQFQSYPLGYVIDEWQSKRNRKSGDAQAMSMTPADLQLDAAISAIIAQKKNNPSTYSAVYWRGEDSIDPLVKHGLPDLVICEGYTSFTHPAQRKWEISKVKDVKHLDWAKGKGFLERAIQLHGLIFHPDDFPENKKIWTKERLEEDIRIIRKKYPESPGQGFYFSLGRDRIKSMQLLLPLIETIDSVLYECYISPAPELTITAPVFEQRLRHSHFFVEVTAKGKENRFIRKYRWFIDNRLVEETEKPQYLWDLRGETEGNHIITVHVVDSGHYRSAKQIPVTIVR